MSTIPVSLRVPAFALLCLVDALAAQGTVTDSSPFRPLPLAAPNEFRAGSGRPGAKYWQQRVDYVIRASLDSATHEVKGEETITYGNRSPDTLRYLWFHVEQNICAPGSVTNVLNQPPLVFLGSAFDFSCQGFPGGGRLQYVKSAGKDLARERFGTTLRVDLAQPLAPGGRVVLQLAWSFNVPPMGAGRMGRDGQLHEIAQWYPRLAVYDDVKGWNHEPYIGAGEFYLEYGKFDVMLTVPASFLVAATGQLMNPAQVLTATQRGRLARARTSDTAIAIIQSDEASLVAATRPTTSGTLTWHFSADSVRDFAWAAAPGLRWDASGYNGTLVETLYRPSATKWEDANRMGREAIKHFSEQWYPYPYSHATTIEGPIEGMEYPMLTFCPSAPTREDQQWVIAHEFGHQWFPMIVGSNERLYPWMDEGFNTFIDLENAANFFKGSAYGDSIASHPLHLYADHAIAGVEQPLITNPTEVRDLFWGGYQKPALMMQLLRFEVLGKDRFDRAFREYARAWAFKHPTPTDFFRVMRDASGMELDWFWRGWVFTTSRLDQAVDSLSTRADGGMNVYLRNNGTMIMPAELSVTYADGRTDTVRTDTVRTAGAALDRRAETARTAGAALDRRAETARTAGAALDRRAETARLPIEMWNQGSRFTWRGPAGRRITGAVLDPRNALPDIDRSNNRWPR